MYNQYEEKLKKAKEIADLEREIHHTEELLREGNQEQLYDHLQTISQKYCIERNIYNISHTVPPKSLKENAENTIDFLLTLRAGKIGECVFQK